MSSAHHRTRTAVYLLAGTMCFAQIPASNETGFNPQNDTTATDQDSIDLSLPNIRGLRLRSIDTSASYFSQPAGVDPLLLGRDSSNFSANFYSQASATISYNLPGRISDLTIVYTPTYNRSANYPEWNRLGHVFAINGRAGKPVARFGRWALNISANANANNFEEFLFVPMSLSQVAGAPNSFDELTVALSQRDFTSDQLASILTGSPTVDAPARLLFFGTRSLTASATTSLAYSYSNRLSFRIGAGGSRMQPLQFGSSVVAPGIAPRRFRSTTAGLNFGVDYALNPRTQIGWSAESHRVFSTLTDAYNTTSFLSISRMVGRQWFVQGRAGAGVIQPVAKSAGTPVGVQWIAGGGLGYRLRSHTWLVQADRALSSSLAIGAGSSVSGNVGWRWHRFASPWTIHAGFGRQHLEGIGSPVMRNWRTHVGVNRRVGLQMFLSAQYVRAAYNGDAHLQAAAYRVELDGVRVSLSWTPFRTVPRQ